MGIRSFDDIPADFRFTDKEWELAEADLLNKEIRNEEALRRFAGNLTWPVYFMDFETIMPAIPLYDESRPYQQIPFQYSVHIRQQPGGETLHHEFLGTPPADPRPAFIESLLILLGTTETVLTYNMAFEKSRLCELARDFPVYAERIEAILPRMADLMEPFRNRHLYHPAMKGSYSIKAVLPALVKDLSYDDLEIHEGGTASLTYLSLYEDIDLLSVRKKRENLLKYCRMDTWAMVKLIEVIK